MTCFKTLLRGFQNKVRGRNPQSGICLRRPAAGPYYSPPLTAYSVFTAGVPGCTSMTLL